MITLFNSEDAPANKGTFLLPRAETVITITPGDSAVDFGGGTVTINLHKVTNNDEESPTFGAAAPFFTFEAGVLAHLLKIPGPTTPGLQTSIRFGVSVTVSGSGTDLLIELF